MGMTIRFSTGLANAVLGTLGISGALAGGVIEIRSGSQPLAADNQATGTLLGTITLGGIAPAVESPGTATVTISGLAGSSIDSVMVGGFNIIPLGSVPFNTDNATTAADLRDAIIRGGYYRATASGSVVTIITPPATGAKHNGYAVTTTVSGTLTATSSGNIAGGTNAASGLMLSAPSNRIVSKVGNWSFTGVANGVAGWFRFRSSENDDGASSTTAIRMDGSIAVGGGDMSLSNLNVSIGAPTTIDSFSFTM